MRMKSGGFTNLQMFSRIMMFRFTDLMTFWFSKLLILSYFRPTVFPEYYIFTIAYAYPETFRDEFSLDPLSQHLMRQFALEQRASGVGGPIIGQWVSSRFDLGSALFGPLNFQNHRTEGGGFCSYNRTNKLFFQQSYPY